jgi:uncharacterized membrane protein YbhN (UPF0104 family)
MSPNSSTKIVSWLLMLGGLGWVFHLLADSLNDPRLFLPASWAWFGLATLLVFLSIALNGVIFYLFLHPDGKSFYPLSQVLKLHYSAQLLRYLPGRIWGILYQVSAASGHVPAFRITRANLDWMIFSLMGSSLVSLLLIGYQYSWPLYYLVAVLLVGMLSISGMLLGGVNHLLRMYRLIFPRRLQKFYKFFSALAEARISPLQLMKVSFWFLLSWALYFSGWVLLEHVYPQFSGVDFVALCAFYSLAAIIGVLSAITPAGLGVREAVFLLLTMGSQPPEIVAFFALFARLWLLIIDLGLLFAPVVFFIYDRVFVNGESSKS